MDEEESEVEVGGWGFEAVGVEVGAVDEDAAEGVEEGLGLAGGGGGGQCYDDGLEGEDELEIWVGYLDTWFLILILVGEEEDVALTAANTFNPTRSNSIRSEMSSPFRSALISTAAAMFVPSPTTPSTRTLIVQIRDLRTKAAWASGVVVPSSSR